MSSEVLFSSCSHRANAESRLDVIFSLAFISTVGTLLVWFLGCARWRERLLLVGSSLVTIDAGRPPHRLTNGELDTRRWNP